MGRCRSPRSRPRRTPRDGASCVTARAGVVWSLPSEEHQWLRQHRCVEGIVMELLPQSREALDEYVTASIDDMEGLLRVIEGWAVRSVPDCVALSVTLLDEDLTFTLVDRDATSAPAQDEVAAFETREA